jgi:hypothetical protein
MDDPRFSSSNSDSGLGICRSWAGGRTIPQLSNDGFRSGRDRADDGPYKADKQYDARLRLIEKGLKAHAPEEGENGSGRQGRQNHSHQHH